MEGFLRVDATTLPGSPTNSFLADEVASTCPLLTPSPPTNDLINPLPDNEQPTFTIVEELANKLQHVKGNEKEGEDSASSSSSVLAEPACTQLLNHRHIIYHHMTKTENGSAQETTKKSQLIQLTFKNPPDDYFFMGWNWPLIRKISTWTFLSGLIAMTAVVITMVLSLPKTCNPPTQWYQGNVLYEIFPASFSDSNDDGIGDFRGMSFKAKYLESLGIRGIRLNSIFKSQQYPENYRNITSLIEIAPELGNIQDFKLLIDHLHLRGIYVILDLPVWPFINTLKSSNETPHNSIPVDFVKSTNQFENEFASHDEVTQAISFWLQHGVDGFYLKGLENYVEDVNFVESLRRWKKILGQDRPIIVNSSLIEKASKNIINIVLNNVDLVDIQLNIEKGLDEFSKQMISVLNGTLFSKASMPWVHWNIGNENTERLAKRLYCSNTTVGTILLQLMLPGTPSIFYGDEIGLKQIADPREERKDLEHLHQLAAMAWQTHEKQKSRKRVLHWMHGHPTHSNFDQLELVSKMVKLRSNSPSIYINSVNKDGSNKVNMHIKYPQNDLVIIQRWYPRRKNYAVISNLGNDHITGDLSKLLYAGEIVIGIRADSKVDIDTFKSLSLWPRESVVVSID